MRSDLTDITLIVDRSGSMESCRVEAENGVNHFIDEQKTLPGEAIFSLVQFDNHTEFVHSGAPMKAVPKYTLTPRGWTALLDAVGRAINETGERLSKIVESERPGLVVFVIVTDGQENSSKEFTKAKIKEMIERQQNEYHWKFTFLGANQDAFAEGLSMGIPIVASNCFVPQNAGAAYRSSSSNVGRMRTCSLENMPVACAYTPEETEAMNG